MPLLAFSSEKICSENEHPFKFQFISEDKLTEDELLKALEILNESSKTIDSSEQIKEIHQSLALMQLYFMRKIANLYPDEQATELLEYDLSINENTDGGLYGKGFGLLGGIDGYCRAIGKIKRNIN